MPDSFALDDIAHTIQLALAPSFLLTAVSAILSLLTGRLGRVVDRARQIEQHFTPRHHPRHDAQVRQLRQIDERIKFINRAIALCTASAMVVCIVIAGLFSATLLGLGFGKTMAVAFIVAMLLLISGLVQFIFEIRIAVRATRVEDAMLERE